MVRNNRIDGQLLVHYVQLKKYHRSAIATELYFTHMLAVEKNRTDLITPEDLRKIRASLEINLVGNLRNLLRNNANSRLAG